MAAVNDNELLEMLRNGSLQAYEIVFKKYYGLLCMQAALLLKDEVLAEDIVEDFFVAFWDKKMYRRINHSLKAYLCRAVRNSCLNEINRNKLLQLKLEEYQYYKQKKTESIAYEHHEQINHLHQLLKDFPAQRLRALTLVYLENKKYREAAEEMGVSINSVKTHLKIALSSLREKLNVNQ